ncbi:MAG: hypothetical protein AAF637_18375, partial [Pseudomonadota bacterium]
MTTSQSTPLLKDLFISCLHIKSSLANNKLSWRTLQEAWYCYILDKFHSGNYPNASRDELVSNARGLFVLEQREDLTLD